MSIKRSLTRRQIQLRSVSCWRVSHRQQQACLAYSPKLTFKILRSINLARIGLLPVKSTGATVKPQQRYKTSFNEKSLEIIAFEKGILVYVQDDLHRREYNLSHKLKPRTSSQFFAVAATIDTLSILAVSLPPSFSIMTVVWRSTPINRHDREKRRQRHCQYW